MNLLIDTHTFLWFVGDDPQLSASATVLLESEHTIFLSIGSVWEIAIKVSLGKLVLPQPFERFIREQLALNAINVLPVRVADCARLIDLPFHHHDPFDRLIIAQALVEDMPVVGIEPVFDAYGVERLW